MLERYYRILGLNENVEIEVVRRRYKELLTESISRGNTKMQNSVTEAYFCILASRGVKEVQEPSFAVQRVPVKARLTSPLSLKGVKKALAGVLATVMLFSLSACEKDSIEIGNIRDGYYLDDAAEKLGEITNTSDYYLVKLDGKIYLTKKLNYSKYYDGVTQQRYYDILGSGKECACVGLSLELNGYSERRGIIEDDSLKDYAFFNGEYGLNKILPVGSYICLTNFVSSEKPSKGDIAFWSSNSIEVHKLFEEMVVGDITYKVKEADYVNPLKSFKCTSKDGEVRTLVGYRASNSEKDIGYNYVYNIFDSEIYYIGISINEAYVFVEEASIEGGKTISELRKEYGVEFTYGDVQETTSPEETKEPVNSSEPIASEEPVVSDEPVIDSEPIGELVEKDPFFLSNKEENAKKIESYKDVLVVDVSSITYSQYSRTAPNFEEKGIKYLFVYPSNTDGIFYPIFDNGDYVALACIRSDFSYFSYMDSEIDVYSDIYKDCSSSICSFNDFLKNHGLERYIKEFYTYGDIGQIERIVNSREQSKVKGSEVIVADLGEDTEYARYALFRKIDDMYYNISQTAFFTDNSFGEGGFYNHFNPYYYELCYHMTLEDFMNICFSKGNITYTELINWQDEYTDTDLAIIEDIINGHVNVQLGMDFAEQIDGKKLIMEKND